MMTTDTNYRPKHKRPESYGGSTPRGPQRWARAADNALRNPRSKAAKLFFDRVVAAREIVAAAPHLEKQAFAHMQPSYSWGAGGRSVVEAKRKYTTCGAHCAALQVALDYGTLEVERIALIVGGGSPAYEHFYTLTHGDGSTTEKSYWMYEGYSVDKLDPKTLKRSVKCAVCGTRVGK